MKQAWSGQAVQRARAYMRQYLPCACGQCGKTVELGDRWVVGHIKSRSAHPELTMDVSNWRIEHKACSDASGTAVALENAVNAALRAHGVDFSGEGPAPEPALFRTSLPTSEAIEIQDRLTWSEEALAEYPWLQPLLDVPKDAAPPLAMTRPHPSAVGSYGEQACQWIESTQNITLRWWQRLAITRQLEHDAQGRLVWRTVVESAPRRSGKSVRLRGVALWRLQHGQQLFGETQLVIHTGKDVAIVREIQQKAWRWAADIAGWRVDRANGKEAMTTPGDDRWLARAMHSVYGYDVTLGMVDEGWGVDPGAVDDGLEPATLERSSAQLHLTSTAHRKATSLMRRRIGAALQSDDGETLLMLWAASPGADAGDPETWRSASPHWTADRGRTLQSKYSAALSGEADPEADDLDPMAGFEAQYLNRWHLKPVSAVKGEPIVTPEEWESLSVAVPPRAPDAVAVEGWPGEGLSVARAWRLGEGVVAVAVTDVPDVASAVLLVTALGCRRKATVGASLAADPAWAGRATPATAAVRTAVADLSGLLRDGTLWHDGGTPLTEQVLGLRTSPGADGPRMRSTGRADAVKAVVWAVQAARTPALGKPRILTARKAS